SSGESQGNHPAATVQKPQGAAATSPQTPPAAFYARAGTEIQGNPSDPERAEMPASAPDNPQDPNPNPSPDPDQAARSLAWPPTPDGKLLSHSNVSEHHRMLILLNLGYNKDNPNKCKMQFSNDDFIYLGKKPMRKSNCHLN
ncbi:hypothetical protein ATANTOWER_011440, partial [Ataeniobius toweri]|nr:hypothetical protein [Ataeniobius toweri]